jgi:hypothetical protein
LAEYGIFRVSYSGFRIASTGGPNMRTESYFYRESLDHTIDAICPFCFMTAATADNEEDLYYQESLHHCPTEAFVASDNSHWEA